MFTRAIVKTPGHSLVNGLTEAELGRPDHAKALAQHGAYIDALRRCGLEVLVLDADESFPDSTFIEDAALLLPGAAVITRPAAPSRRGETLAIRPVLEQFFSSVEEIREPGTLDGGDVMQVGRHFYVGLSQRTNRSGAEQLIALLEQHGMSGSIVPVTQFLHLKTGITQVADQTFLATGEFIDHPAFAGYTVLPVADDEAGGANCIAINDKLLIPAGHPGVRKQLDKLGVEIIEVDISEYAKLDGGLTCLSLRF